MRRNMPLMIVCAEVASTILVTVLSGMSGGIPCIFGAFSPLCVSMAVIEEGILQKAYKNL